MHPRRRIFKESIVVSGDIPVADRHRELGAETGWVVSGKVDNWKQQELFLGQLVPRITGPKYKTGECDNQSSENFWRSTHSA